MGSYLTSPITEKYSHSGSYELGNERENKKLVYAVSEMQGWRNTMEDSHLALCNLEKTYDVPAGTSLFAVFDGHAGREVSAFCQQHFVPELVELESFKAGAYREALIECFHKMDDLLRDPRYYNEIADLKNSSPSRSESLLKVVPEDESEFGDTDSMDEKISKRGSREFEDENDDSQTTFEIDLTSLEKLEEEVGESVEKQRAESVNLNFMKEPLQDAIRTEIKTDDASSPVRNESTTDSGSTPSVAVSPLPPKGSSMPDHVKRKMEAANAKGSMSKSEALDLMLQMLSFTRNKNKSNLNAKVEGVSQQEENGLPAETGKVDVTPVADSQFPTLAGCTAIVALMINGKIYVANAGDSRGVLCSKLLSKPTGKNNRYNNSAYALAHPLSFDHKPLNLIERTRIEKAGGFVTDAGRICGNLNLSRSIGDLKYKTNDSLSRAEQMITAEPDVTITDIKKEDLFFILACDGVWDILTNEGIIEFIKEKLLEEEERNCEKIIESMFTRCLSINPLKTQGLGGDNMTCILVFLKPMEEVIAGLRESV